MKYVEVFFILAINFPFFFFFENCLRYFLFLILIFVSLINLLNYFIMKIFFFCSKLNNYFSKSFFFFINKNVKKLLYLNLIIFFLNLKKLEGIY